ncbi:hypothetical protein NNJEOMEG_01506 [Fundidesulfovibrio magnetotacticus]|uniref:Potassium channel domain-containing protein n=1 Tax=Fundidesulfovibrio magnetotacticus TaxID=2730080 RepID=A0A6V8LLX1_9BACT|nr:potassium channel family protein [Fundidesulfovibrio magnetotacticus]GFK93672.1 hypothetical protein NNJEOMEG_01506 [Fundidesulfovibrio magnetotacticus]
MIHLIKAHREFLSMLLLTGMLVLGGHLPYRLESALFFVVVFLVALLSSTRNAIQTALLGVSTVFYLLAWHDAFHQVLLSAMFCVSGLICLAYGVSSTIAFVLTSREVSRREVFALVNCYMLVGYFFALLYTLVENAAPGSFLLPARPERLMDSLIYLSFSTMTTVGYGDAAPVSTLAQRLCVSQAVFGQFYFALVVAYLLNKLFQQGRDVGDQQ